MDVEDDLNGKMSQCSFLQFGGNKKKGHKNRDRARDICVESLWPYSFSGPYYRSISVHREWRCKKCNRSKDDTDHIDGYFPYFKSKRTVLSYEVCKQCIDKAKRESVKLKEERASNRKQRRKSKRTKRETPKTLNEEIVTPPPPTLPFSILFGSRIRKILTQEMREDISVRSALCIIPPKSECRESKPFENS